MSTLEISREHSRGSLRGGPYGALYTEKSLNLHGHFRGRLRVHSRGHFREHFRERVPWVKFRGFACSVPVSAVFVIFQALGAAKCLPLPAQIQTFTVPSN